MRVVSCEYLRDMNCPLPPARCMLGLHAEIGLMSWDSWARGCHGTGNNTVLKANEFLF